MSKLFHNTRELNDYIKEEMSKEGDLERIYSSEVFLMDLRRSKEEFYISGTLIDPIIHQVKEQQVKEQTIITHAAVQRIREAAFIIKNHPEKIEDVIAKIPLSEIKTVYFESQQFQHFGSIRDLVLSLSEDNLTKKERNEKLDQITFECSNIVSMSEIQEVTANISEDLNELKDAIKKIGKILLKIKNKRYEENELLKQLRHDFASIQDAPFLLKKRFYLTDKQYKENLLGIKKDLLSMTSILKIGEQEVKTHCQNKAVDKIFNLLFKDQNGEFNDKYQQERVKKFLKLFLHQNALYPNISLLNKLDNVNYTFCNPKRKVELNLTDEGLLLQVSFLIQKIFSYKSDQPFEKEDGKFFVKGVAKYKINMNHFNEEGWVAKYDLIDSTLECDKKFKAMLDRRTILEKFQEFIETLLNTILAFLNVDRSVRPYKSKFKPVFFVSDKGSSVSKVITTINDESQGNILGIILNSM